MKFKIIFLSIIIFTFLPSAISAQKLPINLTSTYTNAYRLYKDVGGLPMNAPTVVEVPFSNELIERFDFAILDKTTNSFEPYFFKQEMLINKIPMSVSTDSNFSKTDFMIDDDTQTYAEFPLPEDAQGHVKINLISASPITSSSLTTLLDSHVALPSSVEIRALIEGKNKIIVAKKKMNKHTIDFPQTTSDQWEITFTFGQPLRISELRLVQKNTAKINSDAIRFLFQPSHSYRIYFNPDRQPEQPPLGETANLATAKEVAVIPSISSRDNPNYIIADVDGDNIPDIQDNCVSIANPNQDDINNNGRGDACDDFDQDGLINSKDNCPNLPNKNQRDADSDGVGDVCDKIESRITERYKWIPWIGIGFAALVIIILFALTAKSSRDSIEKK